ncbi:uncharacterized protein LOC142225614 isoform X2 [Haematobia irritans]|uniref:uncharacterized protein LOC142225614 isoform X2 n=1 Tax=Haematobia irritans TaxID=7368 RepID=UPI003F4FD582
MPVCRVCLAVPGENDDFFQMDDMLKDIFNFCTHLCVQLNDGLPQRLCAFCLKNLHTSYLFVQKAIESDRKLQDHKPDNAAVSIKDPLENISDVDDDIEERFLDNVKCIDGNIAEYPDKDAGKSEEVGALVSLSPDSSKDDSDFLVSIESQIFPKGRYKCKICDKHYFTNVGLQAHMEIHYPQSKSISREIISGIRRKRQRKVAEKNMSENSEVDTANGIESTKPKNQRKKQKKTFPCSVCGKQMISASKLRYHMVMHTGEKDYLCQMCPKAYSTIYALKHHMRSHTGERPYECKFCGDRFLRPTTLKSHMRRHTGERPYGCEICGKRFIQHSSMATHMKLNHMDKTISCPYCEKKYARQTDLNVHLLSHSGDKPFACKQCSSRFTRQSNLKKHMNQQHQNQSVEVDRGKRSTSTIIVPHSTLD